ncbi:MAG TPA: aminotransferase class I/II-fold pyridoxal phosphate-dependent enzyme [Planctomycetota bacterium]|nr:aminotransferase class I/II-fold pyridoxal phosphate-dependent enzyme [Planctomycetota bacterium]
MSDFKSIYDPGVQVSMADVLCLHRNENLLVGRDWAVDAARDLVEQAAISSYPDAACLPLRTAIAELHGVGAEQVFLGNGADEVLSDLFGVLHETYDCMHVLDVRFKVYDLLAERLGFRQEVLAGDAFETGHVDSSGFQGLAVVDSPNAITGRSVPTDELMQLASDTRSFVIWDNVYGEYGHDSIPTPLPANMAFVRSFSKFYGLAGLRLGYCIAGEKLISRMLAQKDVFNVNAMAQVMAMEALRRQDSFEVLRDKLVGNRDQLVHGLEQQGFCVLPSNSVGVLATHPGHSGASIQAALLERKIAVRRFDDERIRDHIRVTVAPMEQIEHFLATLSDCLKAL